MGKPKNKKNMRASSRSIKKLTSFSSEELPESFAYALAKSFLDKSDAIFKSEAHHFLVAVGRHMWKAIRGGEGGLKFTGHCLELPNAILSMASFDMIKFIVFNTVCVDGREQSIPVIAPDASASLDKLINIILLGELDASSTLSYISKAALPEDPLKQRARLGYAADEESRARNAAFEKHAVLINDASSFAEQLFKEKQKLCQHIECPINPFFDGVKSPLVSHLLLDEAFKTMPSLENKRRKLDFFLNQKLSVRVERGRLFVPYCDIILRPNKASLKIFEGSEVAAKQYGQACDAYSQLVEKMIVTFEPEDASASEVKAVGAAAGAGEGAAAASDGISAVQGAQNLFLELLRMGSTAAKGDRAYPYF